MEDYGALSILPPLLSLVLAIGTRNVILSLGLGIFLGMLIVNDGNPFLGLLDFVDRGIFAQLSEPSSAKVVIIICVIGGFVHLLDKSGGMKSFAQRMTRVVDTPVKAQLGVWLMGMAIFFTDSGNSLILGPMFRPIFKSLGICREKLAFIIDSTSSPVCVLIPVISWGVYIMSLMDQSFTALELDRGAFETFVGVLPFQLYPILAIATVPVLAFTRREWGPMARAQERAAKERDEAPRSKSKIEEKRASGVAIVAPMAAMLLVLASLFTYFALTLGALPGSKIQISLVIAYLTGTAVCFWVLRREGVSSLGESFKTFTSGAGQMVYIVIILLLAWSLGDVCDLLHTGGYLASFFDGFVNPGLLPAVVFVLGAALSMSTGSSWGTFALLMPIAIPVAHQLGVPLEVTIAAVLSGGMFGDHCSPVSDTTILSSMSTGCEHADHVNTQLAYAAVAGTTAFIGFLIAGLTGFVYTAIAAVALQVVLTLALARFFGTGAPLRGARNE